MRRLAFVLALLLAAAPAWAQRTPPPPPQAPVQDDDNQIARFQLAQRYLRAGQFDRAITLLEDLYADAPEQQAFYAKLKEAYEGVKRYDDAIALVEARMEQTGGPEPILASERARLLYQQGDEDGAFAAWDEALALAPGRASTYRAVYASQLQARLMDRAAATLEQAREAMQQPDAFRAELAALYSHTGLHERAADEYLALLADDADRFGLVRARLGRYTDGEVARAAYITAAERAVQQEPLYRPYRELLAWLYLEAEDYRAAFDATRAIDRLEGLEGREVFSFARRAVHAEAYEVARDAYAAVLEQYPDGGLAPQALLGLAEAQERWAEQVRERAVGADGEALEAPHYAEARDAYERFLDTYPSSGLAPEVLRRLGQLQQDVFRELDAAEATLQRVLDDAPRSTAAQQARYDLGRLHLQRGELADARLAFSRLVDELRTGDLAEQARYELALLDFYQGQFGSALDLARVLNVNTSDDIANDAIELKVLLNENRGPDSLSTALRSYARAELLVRQRRPAAALDTLDALLLAHGQHPLADDARFLRAQALTDAGRTDEAAQALEELPLVHPQSFLADRALFEAATLRAHRLDDPERAMTIYTRLLTDYPGSLLLPDARARLRTLRDADRSGPDA